MSPSDEKVAAASMDAIKRLAGFPEGRVRTRPLSVASPNFTALDTLMILWLIIANSVKFL